MRWSKNSLSIIQGRKMKKKIILCLAIIPFLIYTNLQTEETKKAQEIINNPKRPANADAGRILRLKEELRITDKGGDFFFQYPGKVKVAPDGSIFISDQDL
jgi:hypothetical protein